MVIGAAGLVVAGCVTQVYCGFDVTYLPALRSDPMAEIGLPGAAVVRTDSDPYGMVLGKPSHAEIVTVYAIEDEASADQILDDAVEEAVAAGWEMSPAQLDDRRFEGSKHFEVGTGTLTISLNRSGLLFIRMIFLDP